MAEETKAMGDIDEEKRPLSNNHATDVSLMADSIANDSTARFLPNGGGADAEVTVRVEQPEEKHDDFVGLKKEELMRYANDPYWVRVRYVLLALFIVAWIAMLVAAIVIIVVAPKCPPQQNLDWWQKGVIYHIQPQSFKDAKPPHVDGFGDIKGVFSLLRKI